MDVDFSVDVVGITFTGFCGRCAGITLFVVDVDVALDMYVLQEHGMLLDGYPRTGADSCGV